MLRLIYSIFRNCFRAYMIPLMRYMANHPERFSLERRYRIVRRACYIAAKTTRISTLSSGQEHLPTKGGYILCPNHQGKYDALGIINTHDAPCSIVMDYNRSNMILVSEIIDLVNGKRLKIDDVRQAMHVIQEIADEVKTGSRFIIFPEGGYVRSKKNSLSEFRAGAFKSALKSRSPIVPVALIDTYKAFNRNSLRKVVTQVHYLEPITYEDYKGMKTFEISEIVKTRISEKIAEITNTKRSVQQAVS
ncbi:MAG: lysophospholipid acyltransferase family protein [Lachnospiraceae bacterium]